MSLTNRDKEIIVSTWSLIRKDSDQAGIHLFKRFFEANPDYVKYFPFGDLDDLEKILVDPRLKWHASRVMAALSTIVDNLDDPVCFEDSLQKVLSSHLNRKIQLYHFENLKKALVCLFMDKLGPDIMNDETIEAWSKAYDVILDTYRSRLSEAKSSIS
ncbi:Cytoglobin-2 [Sarcoptes scabiei]|uniref:Cytoglobin n=1 Tax=Sarcoptes scabiei TaxID=52283 RepID=A0A132AHZ9_SARSC|nr:Cytoglobin-2 [Sarcoptes scabiei]KPM10070.1 cytoglobin-1-like protein [Sarcoptes scabiei]UXI16152.1 Angiotensin-converting enzyme [Sarcoptes scabiei]